MLRANTRVPAGRLSLDFSTEVGMESQTGAAGTCGSGPEGASCKRRAADSSGLTASAIRFERTGKNEMRRSGVLPVMRQNASTHVPPWLAT